MDIIKKKIYMKMESPTQKEYMWELSLKSSRGQVKKIKIMCNGVNVNDCRFQLVNKILTMTSKGVVCFIKNYGKPLDLYYETEAIEKNFEYYPIEFSFVEYIRRHEPQLVENYKKLNAFAKPFVPRSISPVKMQNNW